MNLTATVIWVVVALVVFAFAWRKGYLQKLSDYVKETREELRKCAWPTWAELKGSTIIVSISIIAMGLFTVAVDWIFVHVMFWISKV